MPKIDKKKFKALMIDIDGTLVPYSRTGKPSQKVIEAISKACKILHVGVATSRPYFLVKDIVENLKLTGPSIVNGGAQIYDTTSHQVLWERKIQLEDLKQIIKIFNKHKLGFIIQDQGEDIQYSAQYKPVSPLQIYAPELEESQAEDLVDQIAQIPTIAAHKGLSWVRGKFDVVASDSYATKQHGIFKVAKLLNIKTHEIIGMGDGYNDFPLLMACGLKVAMGNAVEDLKEIADYVAPTVEQDGVADVIEKFIL